MTEDDITSSLVHAQQQAPDRTAEEYARDVQGTANAPLYSAHLAMQAGQHDYARYQAGANDPTPRHLEEQPDRAVESRPWWWSRLRSLWR